MITYPDRITEQKNGSYTWTCSIEVKYYRKTMGIGFKACLGIAVFLLALGGFIAFRERDLEPFLIVLGCTAVFLLITFLVFGLTLLATDPQESYEMTETYIKTGSGKSSAYFNYKKARTAIFWRQQYIELQGKIAKMRIYIPNEDYDFVKRYIMRRFPGDCEIRYE